VCGSEPTIEHLGQQGVLVCSFGNTTVPYGMAISKGRYYVNHQIPFGVPVCQCVTPPSLTCIQKACPRFGESAKPPGGQHGGNNPGFGNPGGEHGGKPPTGGEHGGNRPPPGGEHGGKPPTDGQHGGNLPPTGGEHGGNRPPFGGQHGGNRGSRSRGKICSEVTCESHCTKIEGSDGCHTCDCSDSVEIEVEYAPVKR